MITFPLKFQLKDNAFVTVMFVTKGSFNFDIVYPNGSLRTFRWRENSPHSHLNRKGEVDERLKEAIEVFLFEMAKT